MPPHGGSKGKAVNLHRRFALSLALVTLIGLTAAGASAQTITKATFTLPLQAYWNSTLLQPGDYSLSLERGISGVNLIFLRGGEGTKAIFVTPAGTGEVSGRSCLKIDDLNGTYVVRELDAGPVGKSYRFGIDKAVRNLTQRSDARQVTVPVATAAGL
jgi:hypothetical protein